ncbi:mycothiol-dependent nitroreductase Rv2466c family protein [Actinopolyspora mortivallis]|uniref:Uncharacterized protein n=1 Tax=Actinopolyspora mortivallis TaxID=33906 RepID=A0A2T0GWR3_ACTMO|nr:DsbA family protein [Actinopolyspora mortivallis]PRW63534.1 hypothetical protein CEP50_10080 [Actinopolyspora mortivallis]
MAVEQVEFHFDPVCPFCWVTSQWVREVVSLRSVEVSWRPLSLRVLNEGIGYADKPADYPQAHQRGLEMLRLVVAAERLYGPEIVGELYRELGQAVWDAPAPSRATFEAVLAETARRRDLGAVLSRLGLDTALAEAASDSEYDEVIRQETHAAVDRAGGGVGTPILSFAPPDGPAFFGPVIDTPPEGQEALRLWDAVTTLAYRPGFAELKRGVRSFPDTPLSAAIAGERTRVR